MTDWIGKEISHYRVTGQIGQGGMGVVYAAEDLSLGRPVVLKTLRPDLAADERLIERFRREARACASISHPNITTIYEIGCHGTTWFICMEFVAGRTLRSSLREGGPSPPAEALRIAAQVADALGAAHQLGIVHRDMKPENIMLTPAGGVKVLDFGLAAFVSPGGQSAKVAALQTGADRLTTEGIPIGTLHYMSPEQSLGRPVTPASDVFSLGAVLYEMLTGMPPFRGETTLAVLHSIAYDQPPPLGARVAGATGDLEALLRRALRKDASRRHATGYAMREEILQTLRSLAADLGDSALVAGGPPSGPPRASPPASLQPAASVDLTPAPAGGFEAAPLHEAPTRLSGSAEAILAGRASELETLAQRLEGAFAGAGSLVLVAGEAGIGKTRLVTELGRAAERRGARYLSGRCLFREGGLPYHPFLEAAERLIAYLGLDEPGEFEAYIRERMPSLAGRLPILTSFLHVGARDSPSIIADKEHLLDAISALFLAFARERPLVLLIDDLHWADQATLDLLLYLARACQQSQGLIVGTYRPEELGTEPGREHPLHRLIGRMSAGDHFTEVRLNRLAEEATAEVISSVLAGSPPPPEFAERLHAETAGNPFYLLETLKLLQQDGTLKRRDHGWVLTRAIDRLQIPGRVHDVIARRLAGVTAADREVLELASAEGMSFHSGTLAGCLDLSRIRVLGSLQRAEKEHHLLHADDEVYTFDHPLIREILLEAIIPELRREYHRLIGRHLAANRKGRPGEESAIAWQLLEAGEDAEALPYLLEAGHSARRLYANAEALAQLDRAETILSGVRDTARGRAAGAAATEGVDLTTLTIRLHKERGRLHQRLGDHERALSDFMAMLRRAEEAAIPRRQAHALSLLSDLYYAMGDYDQSLESARRSHDVAERAGDKRSLSHALRSMGAIYFYRAQYDEALSAHNRSIELQRELDDLSGYAENLNKVGNIHLFRGDNEKAEAVYSAALALGRRSGNRLAEAESLNNLGVLGYNTGQAETALAHFEACLAIKRAIGDRRSLARSLNNLALVFEMQGDLQGALRTHVESLELIRSIGDQGSIVSGLSNLANVYEKMGLYADALESCREGLAISESIGDRWVMPYTLNALGQIELWLGRPAGARTAFDRALSMARSQGQRTEECLSLRNLGALRVAEGDPEAALALWVEALELARAQGARDRESEIVYLIGLHHAADGDRERAGEQVATLEILARSLGLKEAVIRLRHLQGLTAMLEGRAGKPIARERLAEAAGLAGEVGVREIEWRIREELARALEPDPGAAAERERARAIVRELAEQAETAGAGTEYRSDPRRRALLTGAAPPGID